MTRSEFLEKWLHAIETGRSYELSATLKDSWRRELETDLDAVVADRVRAEQATETEPNHGYERRGFGFACVEGDACGNYVHPGEPTYAQLVDEERKQDFELVKLRAADAVVEWIKARVRDRLTDASLSAIEDAYHRACPKNGWPAWSGVFEAFEAAFRAELSRLELEAQSAIDAARRHEED